MRSVRVRLTEYQRHRINLVRRRSRSLVESQRCRIVLLLASGYNVIEIEHRIGCVRSTVYTTLYRFEELGVEGLYDRRRSGQPRKLTQEAREKLLGYLRQQPRELGWQRSTWTRESLALQLRADTGIEISTGYVGAVLRQERVRRGRPRPALRIPVKGRANRIKEIEAIEERASEQEEVVHVDEADVDLNPRIGLMYIPRGTQPQIPTPGKNVKYYVAGALNIRTGGLVYTHGMNKNSSLFISLVEALDAAYPHAKTVHVILDNYIIHKSRQTQRAIDACGGKIKLHFLPPYSPQNNRIERLWKQLHDNVTRNHRHPTMTGLWKDIVKFMIDIQPFPGTKVSTLRAVA